MKTASDSNWTGPRWADELWEAARQQGDEPADALARLIFSQSSGLAPAGSRLGYNRLVDLADMLSTDAELFLVKGSHLNGCFEAFPEALREYYEPMPAPAWVEPEKLHIAAQLWLDHRSVEHGDVAFSEHRAE